MTNEMITEGHGSRRGRDVGQLAIISELYLRSHVGLNVLAAVARTGSTALVALVAPKLLGVQQYGLYAYMWWIATFVGCIAVLGYPNIVGRLADLSKLRIRRVISIVLGAAALFFVGISEFRGVVLERRVLALLYATGASYSLNLLLLATLRKAGKYENILRAEIAAAGIRGVILVIALTVARDRGTCLIGGECLAQLMEFFLLSFAVYKIKPHSVEHRDTSAYASTALSLGALGIIDALLWQRTEVFFLSYAQHPLHDIGVFSFTLRLATVFTFIPSAMLDALYPALADRRRTRSEIDKMQSKYLRFYVAFNIVVFIVAAIAFRVIYFEYFTWLGLALIAFRLLEGIAGFYSTAIYARYGEKYLWAAIAFAGLISVTGNLLLTRRYGFHGAVASYMIAHAFLAAMTIGIYVAKIRKRIASSASTERQSESAYAS